MKHCESSDPVNVTLGVMGGKWKPLLLWLLTDKPLRFSKLEELMPGITQKMLTQQLRDLESHKLITRKVYPVVPPKVEYFISAYGLTLSPVLEAMAKWGETHRKLNTLVE